MKQEKKDLLLQDLCGRLPYGVKVKTNNINILKLGTHTRVGEYVTDVIEPCKPYLFPLSSMTEEQEEEFNNLFYRYHESAFIFNERFSHDRYSIKNIGFYPSYLQDWLNKNHFDYRGLIPMELAIDATGLNIY